MFDKIKNIWNTIVSIIKSKEDNMVDYNINIEVERREKIIQTFQETDSYTKTAEIHKITRQRVHQIVKKYAQHAKRQHDKKKEKEIERVLELLGEGMEVTEIAKETGLRLQKVYHIKHKHYKG